MTGDLDVAVDPYYYHYQVKNLQLSASPALHCPASLFSLVYSYCMDYRCTRALCSFADSGVAGSRVLLGVLKGVMKSADDHLQLSTLPQYP